MPPAGGRGRSAGRRIAEVRAEHEGAASCLGVSRMHCVSARMLIVDNSSISA